MSALLVYGVAGFTGALVSRELARRGVAHLAAGRRAEAVDAHVRSVDALGDVTGKAAGRAFGLDHPAQLAAGLDGVRVVLNCAGPFGRTAAPLAAACIARGIHYLDLSGEVAEHASLLDWGDAAAAAGMMLLPGVGFGVVPTEAAAVLAVERLGGHANKIVIAYETRGGASRGTLETVLRGIHLAGTVRRNGRLEAALPGAWRHRLELGGGQALVVYNPWRADLVSAHVSTGVPEIETYATFPAIARFLMRSPRLMSSGFGRWLVERIIRSAPEGPSPKDLARGATRVLAVAEGDGGQRAEVRIHGPEAYVFTARSAAAIAERVLHGAVRPGFATPAQVLGAGWMRELEGVEVQA
ncbi:MAG TPA: saccharopine dehydrogenase NADP-binding domain-containing protein [Polyangia bacterium]|nr:saccharopine dehydrogenase NADP-binding domain-containing protein [Polyangia bacterium]